jgi:addiction module HigA family antidote
LNGRNAHMARRMWKLWITIRKGNGHQMPPIAIHPGEHLAEELDELQMSAAALARHLKVPTNRITQILNGDRDITADTALRLAHFFGTSAQFWVNLQTLYDLRIAQQETGKAIKALPTLKRVTTLHA